MTVSRTNKWVAPCRGTHTLWLQTNPTIPEGVLCISTDRLYTGSSEWFLGETDKTYSTLVDEGKLRNYDYSRYKAIANGIASLDSRIKVPIAQLPITISTATPTASDGNNGDIWIVIG